ncbi:MAG: hypothetical protein J7M25_16740 [Deltaproteobacteria bacterium]|nr:hypothetical protein [Deltaproteobacteria bacterium]
MGRPFQCTCQGGKNHVQGKTVAFEQVQCPKFLWTHALVRFRDVATGRVVYEMLVKDWGRKSLGDRQPLISVTRECGSFSPTER